MTGEAPRYTKQLAQWYRACAEMISERYKDATMPASGYIESHMKLVASQQQVAVAINAFHAWYRAKYATNKNALRFALSSEVYGNLPLAVAGMLSEFAIDIDRILAVANTLNMTASFLHKHQWMQGGSHQNGAYDLLGALDTVIAKSTIDWTTADRHELWTGALDTLTATIGSVALAGWNDTPGRKKGEVVALLRSCADQLEIIPQL